MSVINGTAHLCESCSLERWLGGRGGLSELFCLAASAARSTVRKCLELCFLEAVGTLFLLRFFVGALLHMSLSPHLTDACCSTAQKGVTELSGLSSLFLAWLGLFPHKVYHILVSLCR